jgi:hypothetical protein
MAHSLPDLSKKPSSHWNARFRWATKGKEIIIHLVGTTREIFCAGRSASHTITSYHRNNFH